MINQEKTACFTGHRRIPKEHLEALPSLLDRVLPCLIEAGVNTFLCGGALGFDTIAAEAVLRQRASGAPVRLVLVLPCRNQTRGWSAQAVALYERILANADEVIYTAEQYFSGCMHVRNRYLVEHAAVCVAYLTDTKGGTFYTVSLAKDKEREILNLACAFGYPDP